MHTHAQTCRDVHTHATHAELLTAHSAFPPLPTPSTHSCPLRLYWHMFEGTQALCWFAYYIWYIYMFIHTYIDGLNMNTRIVITMINRLRPIGKCSGLMTKDSNWRQAPTPPSPLPVWNYGSQFDGRDQKQLKVLSCWSHGLKSHLLFDDLRLFILRGTSIPIEMAIHVAYIEILLLLGQFNCVSPLSLCLAVYLPSNCISNRFSALSVCLNSEISAIIKAEAVKFVIQTSVYFV